MTTENHATQTLAEGGELKTSAVAICGDNATLPAKFVGCGQPIATIEELYRCTHCSVPFHLDCAEHHFKDSTVLTLQMVEEIERESLPHTGVLPMTTEQPAQTLAEGDELKTAAQAISALPELIEALNGLVALIRPHADTAEELIALEAAETALAKAGA